MKWEEVFCNTFSAIRKRLGIPEPSEHKTDMVKDSRSDDNALCHEMLTTFGFTQDQVHRAAERFHLGRSKSGQTIYWMIDDMGRCLDGRLGDTWVSTLLKHRYPSAAPYLRVEHCLFGLHQISEENHPDPLMGRGYLRSSFARLLPKGRKNERATGGAVASPFEGGLGGSAPLLVRFLGASEKMNRLMPIGIVQSERSAVILSELCPDLLWMAYSYPSNLMVNVLEPLQGHKVTLYPLADPYMDNYLYCLDLADRARKLYHLDISVSRFLEDNASDDQKSRNIDLLEFMLES